MKPQGSGWKYKMFELPPPSTYKSDSVDGRNPKQPPGLYKTLKITVDKRPTSTG